MITYNTTFVLTPDLLEPFVEFLREEYVPLVLHGGILCSPTLKLVEVEDTSNEAISLALSFEVKDYDELNDYFVRQKDLHSSSLLKRFGESVLGFTTLLKHIPL